MTLSVPRKVVVLICMQDNFAIFSRAHSIRILYLNFFLDIIEQFCLPS